MSYDQTTGEVEIDIRGSTNKDDVNYLKTKIIGDELRRSGIVRLSLPATLRSNSKAVEGFLAYIAAIGNRIPKGVDVYYTSNEEMLKGIKYAHKIFGSHVAMMNLGLSKRVQSEQLRPVESGALPSELSKKLVLEESTKSTKVVDVHVKCIRPRYHDLREWMSDPSNVYIGRGGVVFIQTETGKERYPKKDAIWANPYKSKDLGINECLTKYETYIRTKIETENLYEDLRSLKGKNLGCWCVGSEEREDYCCHGHVLLKLLQEFFPD